MANILLHDTRVDTAGSPPHSDIYKAVNEQTNIEEAIRALANQIDKSILIPNAVNTLNILAHGSPRGILLGRPGLSQTNVGIFAPLYRKVSTIVFHSCAATFRYADSRLYNGENMCLFLSQIVECTVIAADETQYLNMDRFFSTHNTVEYAPWQGIVSVYINGRLDHQNSPFSREAGIMP